MFPRQDVPLENARLLDIVPQVCGSALCPPGYSFGPAVREYTLLHYVVSGQGMFHTPRDSYPVREGQLFVIRAGETTLYTADTARPWEYIWIGFSSLLAVEEVLNADVLDAPGCAHLFQELLESSSLQNGREWYVCGKIFELLAKLRAQQASGGTVTSRYVRMAEDYIRANYMRDLKVGALAEALNLDRSYFSTIFKRHTGKPPQQYLVDYRLHKAAELMAVQGLSPGEAARRTGYPDIVNFSRMFRRKFGVAPSRYQLTKNQ